MEQSAVPSGGELLRGDGSETPSRAAIELDSEVDFPLIVFGSLPAGGRDLDLLVRDENLGRLLAALRRLGYEQRLGMWVRSRDCDLDAIEPVPLSEWRLPPATGEGLFAASLPIDGLRRLRRPAPQHALLIAARRIPRRGQPGPKLHRRAMAALYEDPASARHARAAAPQWRVEGALDLLLEEGPSARPGRLSPTRRVLGRVRAMGARAALSALLRRIVPRRRKGLLISISGLDGSGKSTQAEAVERILWRSGRECRTMWVPLQPPRPIHALARLVKRALAPLAGGGAFLPTGEPDEISLVDRYEIDADAREPARSIRRRSRLISTAWAMTLVLSAGVRTGYRVRRLLWRGEDVVCDRYALDAWVYMNYRYGAAALLGPLWELLRLLLLPRPDLQVQLTVPPATAASRKPEFTVAQNARRASDYAEVAQRVGATIVDSSKPRDEVCAEICELVLSLLER